MPNENHTTKPQPTQKLDAGGDCVRRLVRLFLGGLTQVSKRRLLEVMHRPTIPLAPIMRSRSRHARERRDEVSGREVFNLFGERHAEILPEKKNNAMRKIVLAMRPHCVYSLRMSNTKQLEKVINSAIINGNRILEGGLGTILPTRESERIGDKIYRADQKRKAEVGKSQLSRFDRRAEQGEVRYYDGANRYAVVNSMGRILWFEKRKDGFWYAAR